MAMYPKTNNQNGEIMPSLAFGLLELNSIPRGVFCADAMVKAADVCLDFAQAVCAGKYIALVSGGVADVRSAVEAGVQNAGINLVDSIIIPNIDERVLVAITATGEIENPGALGLLETFSLAAAVIAADCAVKTARIELVEVRLGRGLGGKAFVILTGDVSAVQSAISAATSLPELEGLLSSTAVIAAPHKDILENLL